MVTTRQVKDATECERTRMIEVLYDAFMTYPPYVGLWGAAREPNMAIFTATVDHALEYHEAWVAEEGEKVVGVVLVAPPGAEFCTEEDLGKIFGPAIAQMSPDMSTYLQEKLFPGMEALFKQVEPHAERDWWYVSMLGVDPPMQGKSVGSALLTMLRKRADEAGGMPVGLNTQSAKNIGFYNKNGFQVRADLLHTLPNGSTYHDHLLSNPGDTSAIAVK